MGQQIRWRKSTIVLALSVVVAACGSSDGSTASSTTQAATTTTTVSDGTAATTQVPAITGMENVGGGPDWPSYGLDSANSNNNAAEQAISTDNVASLDLLWQIDGLGGVTGTPAVVDGIVYFGDWLGSVHAVSADNWDPLWETAISERPISASVAAGTNVIVAADLAGSVYALDRATGDKLWSSPLGESPDIGIFSSPALIDDLIIVGVAQTTTANPDFRGSVVALSLADGSERWRFYTDTDDELTGSGVSVWSSAAIDTEREIAFIGTGNTNYRDAGSATPDSPYSNGVIAIDYTTGELVWVFRIVEGNDFADFDVGASPNLFTLDGREVLGIGGKSGDYAVVDRDTGDRIWQTNLTSGSPAGGVMSTAALGNGAIYVTSNNGFLTNGSLFALNAGDGSIVWQHNDNDPIMGGSVALANGVVYYGTWGASGTIHALNASDRSLLWSATLDGAVSGSISISDGILYVGYGSGTPGDLGPAENGGLVAYALP